MCRHAQTVLCTLLSTHRELQPFLGRKDDVKHRLPAWVSSAVLWCVQSKIGFSFNNQCCVFLALQRHAAPPNPGATSHGSQLLAAAAITRDTTPLAQSFESSL